MDKGQLLIALIELIIFILPVGALIWKAAVQTRIIKELEMRQTELKQRVDKIEDHNEKSIDEIKQSLNALNVSYAEIKTALEYITKSISKEGEK